LAASASFPLRVPRGFVAKMRKGDPNDPLLRQVLPLGSGTGSRYQASTPIRLAIKPRKRRRGVAQIPRSGAAAGHRCLRGALPLLLSAANFPTPNPGHRAPLRDWRSALAICGTITSMREVHFQRRRSAVAVKPATGYACWQELHRIPHLVRLRIHSRLPIVLPERVDDGLLALLASHPPATHTWSFTPTTRAKSTLTVRTAAADFGVIGVTLLNQSVLLRGVNDEVERCWPSLSEALFTAGVLPYYLHLLDRVRGAAHYEVKESEASAIMEALRERLPGYLVPRLVREQPGQLAKTPVWDVASNHGFLFPVCMLAISRGWNACLNLPSSTCSSRIAVQSGYRAYCQNPARE
jgi:hypothetical protein